MILFFLGTPILFLEGFGQFAAKDALVMRSQAWALALALRVASI